MGLPTSLVSGLIVFADSIGHGHPLSWVKRLPDYYTPRRRRKDGVLLALTLHRPFETSFLS